MPDVPYTLSRFDRKKWEWFDVEVESLEEAKRLADEHDAAAEVWWGSDQVYVAE
jgi:hypothetical protein